jgi:hypothetical protein
MEMMYVGLSLFRCTRSCPGVLLAKKRIFKNVTPSCVGGGVVEHVSRDGAIWIEVSSCSESGCTRLILKVRTGRISKRGKRRERPISLELFGVVLSLRWYVQVDPCSRLKLTVALPRNHGRNLSLWLDPLYAKEGKQPNI